MPDVRGIFLKDGKVCKIPENKWKIRFDGRDNSRDETGFQGRSVGDFLVSESFGVIDQGILLPNAFSPQLLRFTPLPLTPLPPWMAKCSDTNAMAQKVKEESGKRSRSWTTYQSALTPKFLCTKTSKLL